MDRRLFMAADAELFLLSLFEALLLTLLEAMDCALLLLNRECVREWSIPSSEGVCVIGLQVMSISTVHSHGSEHLPRENLGVISLINKPRMFKG